MKLLRLLFAFLLGAACGLVLTQLVVLAIHAFAPHEHALKGFVGVIFAFVSLPTLGVFFAMWLGRPKPGPENSSSDD